MPSNQVVDPGPAMNGSLPTVTLASLAFAVGGAVMKPSHGFSRLWPSLAVAALFLTRAVLLARAVQTNQLATTYLIGLGIEAANTIALGLILFGEHLSVFRLGGLILIAAGITTIPLD